MVNFKTTFFVIVYIIYHPENVYTVSLKQVLKQCADDIYNNCGFRRAVRTNIKEHVSKHALLYLTLSMLTLVDAQEYYTYIRGQMYVDENLDSPIRYCDKIGERMDVLENPNYLYEIISCKSNVFEHFPPTDDPLAVAQYAYDNLLEYNFSDMANANFHAGKYYFTVVEFTYFNDDLMTPLDYCKFKYDDTDKNKTKKRGRPRKEDKGSKNVQRKSKKSNEIGDSSCEQGTNSVVI